MKLETLLTSPASVVAILPGPEELPALLAVLQELALPKGAITVFGRPDAQLATGLAAALEPGHRLELLGAFLGTSLGLVGAVLLLSLPGLGPLVLAGGTGLVLAEEALLALFGLGLGGALGAQAEAEQLGEQAQQFKHALEAGRWIVLVQGSTDEVQRAWERLLPIAHIELSRA